MTAPSQDNSPQWAYYLTRNGQSMFRIPLAQRPDGTWPAIGERTRNGRLNWSGWTSVASPVAVSAEGTIIQTCNACNEGGEILRMGESPGFEFYSTAASEPPLFLYMICSMGTVLRKGRPTAGHGWGRWGQCTATAADLREAGIRRNWDGTLFVQPEPVVHYRLLRNCVLRVTVNPDGSEEYHAQEFLSAHGYLNIPGWCVQGPVSDWQSQFIPCTETGHVVMTPDMELWSHENNRVRYLVKGDAVYRQADADRLDRWKPASQTISDFRRETQLRCVRINEDGTVWVDRQQAAPSGNPVTYYLGYWNIWSAETITETLRDSEGNNYTGTHQRVRRRDQHGAGWGNWHHTSASVDALSGFFQCDAQGTLPPVGSRTEFYLVPGSGSASVLYRLEPYDGPGDCCIFKRDVNGRGGVFPLIFSSPWTSWGTRRQDLLSLQSIYRVNEDGSRYGALPSDSQPVAYRYFINPNRTHIYRADAQERLWMAVFSTTEPAELRTWIPLSEASVRNVLPGNDHYAGETECDENGNPLSADPAPPRRRNVRTVAPDAPAPADGPRILYFRQEQQGLIHLLRMRIGENDRILEMHGKAGATREKVLAERWNLCPPENYQDLTLAAFYPSHEAWSGEVECDEHLNPLPARSVALKRGLSLEPRKPVEVTPCPLEFRRRKIQPQAVETVQHLTGLTDAEKAVLFHIRSAGIAWMDLPQHDADSQSHFDDIEVMRACRAIEGLISRRVASRTCPEMNLPYLLKPTDTREPEDDT